MVRHAIASVDKQTRRDVILRAAGALFVAGGGDLPSAARIAEAAGLAKGTLYLYFDTREEIFAVLLLEGWIALMTDVDAVFRTTKGRRADKVAAFLATYLGSLARRPELLPLDGLSYGVLDGNLRSDKLSAFKRTTAERLAAVGATVDAALRLDRGRGVQLLTRSYALTRGLWQLSQPHADGAGRGQAGSDDAPEPPAFADDLKEALAEYWRGALASA